MKPKYKYIEELNKMKNILKKNSDDEKIKENIEYIIDDFDLISYIEILYKNCYNDIVKNIKMKKIKKELEQKPNFAFERFYDLYENMECHRKITIEFTKKYNTNKNNSWRNTIVDFNYIEVDILSDKKTKINFYQNIIINIILSFIKYLENKQHLLIKSINTHKKIRIICFLNHIDKIIYSKDNNYLPSGYSTDNERLIVVSGLDGFVNLLYHELSHMFLFDLTFTKNFDSSISSYFLSYQCPFILSNSNPIIKNNNSYHNNFILNEFSTNTLSSIFTLIYYYYLFNNDQKFGSSNQLNIAHFKTCLTKCIIYEIYGSIYLLFKYKKFFNVSIGCIDEYITLKILILCYYNHFRFLLGRDRITSETMIYLINNVSNIFNKKYFNHFKSFCESYISDLNKGHKIPCFFLEIDFSNFYTLSN